MSKTLLAHLADRFVAQREDLATEALLFIVQNSDAARAELASTLGSLGLLIEGKSEFRSQVAGDELERPDLSCLVDGQEVALVEAKFWAGLTDNQPVGYLRRCLKSGAAGLVFIVPEQRAELVWQEITRRCTQEGWSVGPRESVRAGCLSAPVDRLRLALITWNALLGRLGRAMASAGEVAMLENLGQLHELCQREDQSAFLPVLPEEVTNHGPRRLLQFCSLVDDLVGQYVAEGLGSTKGLRATGGAGYYGRYVLLEGFACFFQVCAEFWSTKESTPIWLRIKDNGWRVTPELHRALDAGQAADLFRWYTLQNSPNIPLFIPFGKERDDVLDALRQSTDAILDWLKKSGLPTTSDSAGAPPDT